MNLIHKYSNQIRNIFNKHLQNPTLQGAVNFGIIFPQSEKVIASRGKLNYLHMANDSTPLDRAFFVRNIRTPKEYADFVFNLNPIILSMVERNEQSLTGCPPDVAVFHLVTFYRPTVESLAVVPENKHMELTQMYQFIFALIRAPQIKIRLLADNEQQARSRFTDGDTLLFVGRINQNPKLTPAVDVKAESDSVKNHSLPAGQNVGSIESTTTIEGNRNPYQCGIFLSQIPFNGYGEEPHTYQQAEFAVQMISRNKAEFIRTNKASRSIAVVESVSHPFTGDTLTLTKSIGNPTMKIYPKNNRTLAVLPTLSVSAEMEVAHG